MKRNWKKQKHSQILFLCYVTVFLYRSYRIRNLYPLKLYVLRMLDQNLNAAYERLFTCTFCPIASAFSVPVEIIEEVWCIDCSENILNDGWKNANFIESIYWCILGGCNDLSYPKIKEEIFFWMTIFGCVALGRDVGCQLFRIFFLHVKFQISSENNLIKTLKNDPVLCRS